MRFGSKDSAEATEKMETAAADWKVEIAHSIPGRIRLRIHELKEQPELAADVNASVRPLASVHSVEVNPRSGSIVLQFPPAAQGSVESQLHAIFPALADGQPAGDRGAASFGATHAERSQQPRDFSSDLAGMFRKANREVESLTGGIDLTLLVPLLLLLLSVLGFATSAMRKGKFPLPAWYDLLWFAFNTYVILNLTLAKQKEFQQSQQAREASAVS